MERRKSATVTKIPSEVQYQSQMDSWDMKNLSYLRKMAFPYNSNRRISNVNDLLLQGDLTSAGDSYLSEFETDEQFLHYDETVIFSVKPNLVRNISDNVSDKELGTVRSLDSPDPPSKNHSFDEYCILTSDDPTLDNCCSLDVVTVRNESVLANRVSPPLSKARLGSDGYETGSSAGSSVDERSFFHGDSQLVNSSESPPLDDFTSSGKPSFILDGRQSIRLRPQSSCPFCGEIISITGYNSPNAFENVLQEQVESDKGELRSLVHDTIEKEEPQDAYPLPTSPYYVRLRRNLYLPASTPFQIGPPKNFSVDQQGQLLIDYTANWEGLGKYIENLKR